MPSMLPRRMKKEQGKDKREIRPTFATNIGSDHVGDKFVGEFGDRLSRPMTDRWFHRLDEETGDHRHRHQHEQAGIGKRGIEVAYLDWKDGWLSN